MVDKGLNLQRALATIRKAREERRAVVAQGEADQGLDREPFLIAAVRAADRHVREAREAFRRLVANSSK